MMMAVTALLLAVVYLPNTAVGFTASAYLPPLLQMNDGTPISTAVQWEQRRTELKTSLMDNIVGTLPPAATYVGATLLNTTNRGANKHGCYLRLKYIANGTSIELDIELVWGTQTQPLSGMPVMLTQWNHRAWGIAAVQRGYMMLLYPGSDTRDVSGLFRQAYPAASFRKILARAYVASRTIDFMLAPTTWPKTAGIPAVDPSRFCITGHSRNGKQSVLAAAFDERIGAVVGSSPGTPISAPIRFSSPDFNGETVESVSAYRDWWLPSVKSYFGREDEIPADGHFAVALVAPRRLMLATAYSDGEGDITFADEQNLLACQPVYDLLNASNNLHMKLRPGRHHGFIDVQSYMDWFDTTAKGPAGVAASKLFPNIHDKPLLHAFDWNEWNASQVAANKTTPPPSLTSPLTDRINWLLGSTTAGSSDGLVRGNSYCESGPVGSEWDYKAKLMMHDSFTGCQGHDCGPVFRTSLSFGGYITASLFLPCSTADCSNLTKTPLPVVIFLHGFSYQLGFTGIYHLFSSSEDGGLIHAMVGKYKVAVLAFDMTGHGTRQDEGAANFYRRFPDSSRLAAMIGEVQAALDFIHCAGADVSTLPECINGNAAVGPYSPLEIPALDRSKTFVIGYSLGAIVALHAAATLQNIAGVAAFGGWTPTRQNMDSSSTGGNRLLYETHALVPKLGYFKGRESEIPYDYDELIAAIAPRPTLLHTPALNRFANASAVANAAAIASQAWTEKNAEALFIIASPQTPSQFANQEVGAALKFVERFVISNITTPNL